METAGSVSTNCTSAVADDSSRAAATTTSWKLAVTTLWPTTAGVTTNDRLSSASRTLASVPFLPSWPTRPATTWSVVAESVRTTASTSRSETSEVAYDDQDSLAANTAATVASTSTVDPSSVRCTVRGVVPASTVTVSSAAR